MHIDPVLPTLAAVGALLALIGLVLRRLRQPLAAGYLVAGVLLGPDALAILDDPVFVERCGAVGVVLLLFFLGMELSPSDLLERWKVAVVGTGLQIAITVGLVAGLGAALDWPLPRVLVLGFGISLSSTAVVIRLLQSRGETDTEAGHRVTAILLAQDLALVPMILILQALDGSPVSIGELTVQLLGGVAFLAVVVVLARAGPRRLRLWPGLRADRELQVFVALTLCFALALASGKLGLSTATGAFLAGMLVRGFRETHWVERAMKPFEVVLVSAFFLSVGMLIDLDFLVRHAATVAALLAAVLVVNTFLNAALLRFLGSGWRDGLYAGAMLSPIGEFSFVLAALGRQTGAISEYGHQMLLALISVSLVVCSPFVLVMGRVLRRDGAPGDGPPR